MQHNTSLARQIEHLVTSELSRRGRPPLLSDDEAIAKIRATYPNRGVGLNEVCRLVDCGKSRGTRLRDKANEALAAQRAQASTALPGRPRQAATAMERIAAALERIADRLDEAAAP